MENQGLLMLDRALELAEQEMAAVQNEAYEDAIELSRERGEMTNQAWNFFSSDVRDEYRSRLLELKNIHQLLKKIATEAHDKVEASLQQSKQERRRMRGYQSCVTHALQ
ncbi:MAG: hypothetical protein IKN64_11615 [Desulfovibrio sp.]|nr:hypothetical protein [Desulfovibrio sp.]